MKKTIPILILALILPVSLSAWGKKYALGGYDPVSYFTENKSMKGKETLKFKYEKEIWLFASEKHLALFRENPEKYIPQYGGYCAWAAGEKKKFYPSDPSVFLIYKDKLYLNNNKKVHERWQKKKDEYIQSADQFWEKNKKPTAVKMND